MKAADATEEGGGEGGRETRGINGGMSEIQRKRERERERDRRNGEREEEGERDKEEGERAGQPREPSDFRNLTKLEETWNLEGEGLSRSPDAMRQHD